MTTGRVLNIQKYSLQDGPGIRTTVFLKGCPLHCAWCEDPEILTRHRQVTLLDNRCMGCAECRNACRFGVLLDGEAPTPMREETCHFCVPRPDNNLTVRRQIPQGDMTVANVVDEVLRDRAFYESSAGGVTFSGGEPLLQHQFLFETLSACEQAGLHTAVDTSGMCSTDHLVAVAPVTSLFLFDLKLMDNAAHRFYTGAPNDLIHKNLEVLGRLHANIWVRVPVIPGVNDHAGELQALAGFAASVPGVRQINLLPYHTRGTWKQERLGTGKLQTRLAPPSTETLQFALSVFRDHGLTVRLGG